MQDSVSAVIKKATQALLDEVQRPGASIAMHLNLMLNQFLTWPFRADFMCISDSEGKSTNFDTVVYSNPKTQSESQSAEVKVDAVACGIHVVKSLDLKELRAGYEHVATIKRLKRTHLSGLEYPINNTSLGIIFAIDSNIPIEKISEHMTLLNKSYLSSEWPDAVIVLTQGVVNYVVQIYGEHIKGDFFLPNITGFPVMPMYVHLIARGLGLFSVNKMFAILFMHLRTFSPGINLPIVDEVLSDVTPLGITIAAYQFNLKCQLVPVPNDEHLKKGILAPLPFRIEDNKGNILSHLQFISWQEGGAVRLVGKLPLEGILVFCGDVARHAQIIKQSDGAISSVLPIKEEQFREMLSRFQRQSNMKVSVEKPKGTVLKLADEGTTSPFIARLFLGILRLRDIILQDNHKRKEFDKVYKFVLDTLMDTRLTVKQITQILTDHSRKVSKGEIVQLRGEVIHVNESIDRELRKQVAEFLNSSVRVFKDGMQKLLTFFRLDIGFLYKKQMAFENGIAELAKTRPDLSDYLQKTREWSERLIIIRNDLHEGWMLPMMVYNKTSSGIQTIEPEILGYPTTEFVDYMLDRLCCFVEEMTAYALKTQMPSGTSIREVPVSDRKADCPERFHVTFIDGGMPIWSIKHNNSKFEEI